MGRVVAAAVYSAGKKVANISIDEGAEWAAKPGHFVWIGLEQPNADELAILQRQFHLHELAIEDALEKHSRPKLETFGDALFIVTYSPIRENGKLEFIETHIFAGKGYVITSRNGHSKSYGLVRQRCEARPLLLEHGEDFVLYALLDFVTECYQPVTEAIHAELDELEGGVLGGVLMEADILSIHSLRRDVLRLRRYVAPMVEIGEELQKLAFPFIDKNMRPYFRDVEIHVTRQMEDLANLRDIASQTIEIGLLLESSRQSIVQRKFAAWAAILAFPTAIAGIYGMNFQNMPELSWHYGYFAVLGFIVAGCVGLYASFKRSGWL
ncbi:MULTISPECIES: magnesium and cobalt transport protein CorA [unclassified Pseudomonas]|uniref:magnesium and cobalt transport protein CorA n=1 Tax=unclassified Pseudomonas TaxID=196821 RepID=UPI002AC9C1D2|nr:MULTISPECIES: magnesium and cobalt transport protein CorA [unclassified Pseudomonas]MEB0041493.1 magnesium and cobalt transport protein CorA [Pseudomonas sp. MH10]MEB0077965.1 magnesium and cobalt transport protein CorA [Pseudomonas sp. MH10out]MEB0093477.1 magnesium and cobalt transport protein CorA [Pseudomonas sp. CCI4.2]MEB0101679.1 magnesium and cobalt transport protein CorA [Pseudomonas sp. CCI3.2]MEB0121898.1 magnesium and cobalt transport protein CorA [Pseudomonas sp. CCI1.2]